MPFSMEILTINRKNSKRLFKGLGDLSETWCPNLLVVDFSLESICWTAKAKSTLGSAYLSSSCLDLS